MRFKPVGLPNRYNRTKLFSLARRSLGSHAAHVQGLVIVFGGGFLGQALARHKNAERRTKMLRKNSIIVQSPLRRGALLNRLLPSLQPTKPCRNRGIRPLLFGICKADPALSGDIVREMGRLRATARR